MIKRTAKFVCAKRNITSEGKITHKVHITFRLRNTSFQTKKDANIFIQCIIQIFQENDLFFWNSHFFSVIQQVLAIWSLVLLPFLNPAWKSGISQFMYCWSLAWRMLIITLVALYSQQKEDQELTVVHIMNSLCQIQNQIEEHKENSRPFRFVLNQIPYSGSDK